LVPDRVEAGFQKKAGMVPVQAAAAVPAAVPVATAARAAATVKSCAMTTPADVAATALAATVVAPTARPVQVSLATRRAIFFKNKSLPGLVTFYFVCWKEKEC
jgi:hypothetical protein